MGASKRQNKRADNNAAQKASSPTRALGAAARVNAKKQNKGETPIAAAGGGWLAAAAAAAVSGGSTIPGGSGNSSDEDENRDVKGKSTEEVATQTNEVIITEVTRVVETSEKPKSKLPPWAKPWTPPATARSHPNSSSPTVTKDQHASRVAEDTSNGNRSSVGEGSGGLDWINDTVTGE